LVGNKQDKVDVAKQDSKVQATISKLASILKCEYFQISCKDGTNV